MSKVNLVGRERELAELADIEKSPLAELVVVYGRRRVGKTWLIRNYFSNKTGVYFEAIGIYQGTLKEQLTQFCKVISEVFYDSTAIEISESWMEAFELLTKCLGKQPKNKKLFIFIDEFPWMASPRSGIIKAFEYYWNRHWSTMPNLKLIICGSSAAWLIKKIIKHKGGLHNRVTHKIRLMPFSFKETRNYLLYKGVQLSKLQLLKLYFIVGGVPFYLNQIKKNLSVNV